MAMQQSCRAHARWPGVRPIHLMQLARTTTSLLGVACMSPAQTAGSQLASPASPIVTEQMSGTNQLIQSVYAVSASVVWASGHGAVVLRTIDGGKSWQRKRVPGADSLEFRDVHAVSADTAWVLSAGSGTRSRIYRTNDGGNSWKLQFTNTDSAAFYDCFTMLDSKRGIAFSDASGGRTLILRTEDGGEMWKLLANDVVPAPLASEGAFASSGQCVVSAGASTVLIATGSPQARLFRSTNAGRGFVALGTPFVKGEVSGLTGLAFKNASYGMAVGADINRLRTDTSSKVVGVTADGGVTWTMRTRPPLPGALSGVAWVPGAGEETAVVVGFGGAFVTHDAGKSWGVLNDSLYTGVAAWGKTAWIAGGGGRITRPDW